VGFVCDAVLKKRLGMAAPDVTFGLTQLIDSDPDSAVSQKKLVFPKTLDCFDIRNGAQLECEDFHQKLSFRLNIQHTKMSDPDVEFTLSGELKAPEEEDSADEGPTKRQRDDDDGDATVDDPMGVDPDDDLMILDDEPGESAAKRTRVQ
jgi:hypothetical protein